MQNHQKAKSGVCYIGLGLSTERSDSAIRGWSSAGMENAHLLTPSVVEGKSDKASFDDHWLEFGTHTFVNVDGVDPMAANEPMKPSLSDHEHERAVSAYDQSPIDERTALPQDGRYQL
jgi:hypothetical protein